MSDDTAARPHSPSLTGAGLGRRQLAVLTWLTLGPMTTRELADADRMTFVQANSAVQSLEARGFIHHENRRWHR